MLCIDFGNTYTKVALRKTVNDRSELLKDDSLVWDEFNFCVPTVAARFTEKSKTVWRFGEEIHRLKGNERDLKVFRNWKPFFFDGDHASLVNQALPVLSGQASGAEEPPPGITQVAWNVMKSTLPKADLEKIEQKLRGNELSEGPAAGIPDTTDMDYKELALGFFRWLHQFFDPICRKRFNQCVRDIPVRISLPSFGSVAGAESLLDELLSETGWKPDETMPVIAEPRANAIGIFTEGQNRVNKKGTSPLYPPMFGQTGLYDRMRNAVVANGPPTAWALVADIGGYSTDFAMIGFDLTELDASLDGVIDGRPRLAHNSWPLGITDLDRMVGERLREEKRLRLNRIIEDHNQQRLETFHSRLYGGEGRFATREAIFGDSERERADIDIAIQDFGKTVADHATQFLEIHQYDRIDDLILTGGGMMIPAVREAICHRLKLFGVRFVHLYNPAGAKSISSIRTHGVDPKLTRGATAIGGASVFFDFAEST
jgi:hypothetical protein